MIINVHFLKMQKQKNELDLKEKYRAELLFTEESCGVVNYYMYSPLLGNCVFLNGYAVNLHVAVGAEQTAAGTPLVFGGY